MDEDEEKRVGLLCEGPVRIQEAQTTQVVAGSEAFYPPKSSQQSNLRESYKYVVIPPAFVRFDRTLSELTGVELNLRHRTRGEHAGADVSLIPRGTSPGQFANLCSLEVSPKSAGIYLLRLFKMNLATRSKDSWSKITKPPYAYSVSKQGRSYLAYLAGDSGNRDIDALEIDEERVFLHTLGALMRTRRYDEVKHLYCFYGDRFVTERARSHAEDICRKADRADTDRFLADIRQGVRAADICRHLLDNLRMPPYRVQIFCKLHGVPFSNTVEKKVEPPRPVRLPRFIRVSDGLRKNAMFSTVSKLLL